MTRALRPSATSSRPGRGGGGGRLGGVGRSVRPKPTRSMAMARTPPACSSGATSSQESVLPAKPCSSTCRVHACALACQRQAAAPARRSACSQPDPLANHTATGAARVVFRAMAGSPVSRTKCSTPLRRIRAPGNGWERLEPGQGERRASRVSRTRGRSCRRRGVRAWNKCTAMASRLWVCWSRKNSSRAYQ